jgi:hypothetical protein
MKPLESAETRVDRQPDGRLRFSIRHDIVRGVTPAMLVWWFNNMDGTVRISGHDIPRYRAWHPRDHVALTYLRPGRDGRKFSAGAKVRIQELFGRNPKYKVDIVEEVDFLDETGFRHARRVAGREAAAMEYKFTATPDGTLYENALIVGGDGGTLFGKLVNRLRPRLFPDAMGHAWLLHNVEEVGNFQFFLPALYASAAPIAASS